MPRTIRDSWQLITESRCSRLGYSRQLNGLRGSVKYIQQPEQLELVRIQVSFTDPRIEHPSSIGSLNSPIGHGRHNRFHDVGIRMLKKERRKELEGQRIWPECAGDV